MERTNDLIAFSLGPPTKLGHQYVRWNVHGPQRGNVARGVPRLVDSALRYFHDPCLIVHNTVVHKCTAVTVRTPFPLTSSRSMPCEMRGHFVCTVADVHITAFVAGGAIVGAILWDAFETLVLPRTPMRTLRMTRLYYRATWWPWVMCARTLRSD